MVCLCASGCGSEQRENRGFKGRRETVTLGIATEPLSAPFLIAQEKGYFADEGLDITVRSFPYGRVAFEAMLSGDVDLATVAETPIVLHSFKRDDFSIAAMFVYNDDDSKIVIHSDRVDAASGLRGKTVGTTIGTSAHFFLDSYLLHTGTAKHEVRIVDLSMKSLPVALQRGELDAIVVFEPYAHEALELAKGKAMRLPKVEIFRETFNLTVMRAFQKEHPEVLPRALKAIDRAISFMRQNKSEAIAVVVRKLGMDEKYLRDTWDDYVFGLSLDQAFLITLEDVARWAIDNRLTDANRIPNYLGYLEPAGLLAVKPQAVKVIRQLP